MDYNAIREMASSGIAFFSDGDGEFEIITSRGGVTIGDDGKEYYAPEQRGTVYGLVRDIKARDINGETILPGDKRGIFNADTAIEVDMVVIVDGEHWVVTDARPIKPTGTVVAYRPILRRISVNA